MNEMVERAKAAVIKAGYNPATAEAIVRITIAEMRHPARDAEMMEAGMKAVIFGGSPDSVAWNVFHVMIDAALAGAPAARPSPSTGSTEL